MWVVDNVAPADVMCLLYLLWCDINLIYYLLLEKLKFHFQPIKIWNQLPTPTVNCNDLETFKLQLYNYSYT